MISRRTWLGLAFLALPASACASQSLQAGFSLEQMLQGLPSTRTNSEVRERFGEPRYQYDFNHDDRDNEYLPNQHSRAAWKSDVVASPSDLIDLLPVGTKMLLYGFAYGSRANPTSDILFVCIDDSDQVLGWMYGKSLAGHERDAWVRSPR